MGWGMGSPCVWLLRHKPYAAIPQVPGLSGHEVQSEAAACNSIVCLDGWAGFAGCSWKSGSSACFAGVGLCPGKCRNGRARFNTTPIVCNSQPWVMECSPHCPMIRLAAIGPTPGTRNSSCSFARFTSTGKRSKLLIAIISFGSMRVYRKPSSLKAGGSSSES